MIGIWALGIYGTAYSHADTLRTLDGKTYSGEIRFEAGQSLHVIDKGGRNTAVKLSHLLDATFDGSAAVMSRGVVLVDGTRLAGAVDSISDKFVRVSPPGQPALQVPIANVARVVFQPVSREMIGKVPAGSSGLLLRGGDFLESQLRNYDGRSVRMDSPLFGLTEFDTHEKAMALILKPTRALDGDTIIRTTNGSELSADQLSLERGQLHFNAIGIGPMTVQRTELSDIHTGGGGRLIALTDLRPSEIAGGDPAKSYLIDATNIGVSPRLRGVDLEHAIAISAGSSVTFELDGKYDVFTTRAGVPVDVVPTGQLRFAVLVDGKESAEAVESSVDAPATFGVAVRHAKKLTLTVTAVSPAASGTPGIWGDPQLVKHAGQKVLATTEPGANE